MKKMLVLIGAAVFLSCSTFTINTNILGTYVDKDCNCTMTLKNDGTFIYHKDFDLFEHHAEGKWKEENGYIYFDSFGKYGVIDAREQRTNSDSIRIVTKRKHGAPLVGAGIYFNGNSKEGVNTDSAGMTSWKNEHVNLITVAYLWQKYEYSVKDTFANSFMLQIALKESGHSNYLKEKWLIDGDKLIDTENNVWEKRR
jgi:hypothetical protein